MKKRFLLIALAAVLCCSFTACGANDANGANNAVSNPEDYTYEITSELERTATITSYHGTDTSIAIPEQIDGYTITVFRASLPESIEKVDIPDSITDVPADSFKSTQYYQDPDNWVDGALYIDDWLIKVDGAVADSSFLVKKGTKHIAGYAFEGTSISDVTMPDDVLTIGNSAFKGCKQLTNITFGEGLVEISNYAFSGCESLSTINLPDSVRYIGSYAFYNTAFIDNAPNGAVYSGKHLVDFKGRECPTEFVVKDGTIGIGSNALNNRDTVESVTIPDSVTYVGDGAFSGCAELRSVSLGENVSFIGNHSFLNCDKLTSLFLPSSVKHLGGGFANGCDQLTRLTIADDNSTFLLGSNGEVYSKDTQTLLFVPAGVSGAYSVMDGVKFIENNAFESCEQITTISIPDSTTHIGSEAFTQCRDLSSITISSSVEYVGDLAFSYCNNLENIQVDEQNRNYCSINGILFTKDKTVLIAGPKKNITTLTIPEGVVRIEDHAFDRSEHLTELVIPSTVESIGWSAFDSCYTLQSVKIEPGAKCSMEGNVFYACVNLKSIVLPESVQPLPPVLFESCKFLTDIYFGGSEEQWNSFKVEVPEAATVHYNCE